MGYLNRRRRELDEWIADRGLAHTRSLPPFELRRELRPRLELFRGGDVLDAGAGRSPYGDELRRNSCRVTSLDVEQRGEALSLVADIQAMPEVSTATFDGVLCTQVLEHVARPWKAFGEICRVLKPGGYLLLSVPHLSAIHEAPTDFFRFTRFALASLAEEHGLEVREIREVGGCLAFLSHGASVAFLTLGSAIPLAGRFVWALNALLVVAVFRPLDRLLGFRKTYPCNLLLVARKAA